MQQVLFRGSGNTFRGEKVKKKKVKDYVQVNQM